MKPRRTLLACLLLALLTPVVEGQPGVHRKVLTLEGDSIRVDSLSVVPGTFTISWQGQLLEEGRHYRFEPFSATLYLLHPAADTLSGPGRQAEVSYRAMPIDLGREYYRYRKPAKAEDYSLVITPPLPIAGPTAGKLERQGSLSRMITTGNNQNTSLHSDLNLQLSGPLNDKYTLNAAISDRNIPVQPEGTTTNIREFDRMFIEVEGGGLGILAGDMVLKASPSRFLRYSRKVQGITGSYTVEPEQGGIKQLTVKGGLAMSRGKYARNEIKGVEGNQGPYPLRGSNGESFIVVLSGSERVYVDGKELIRGSDRDYVIDYNLAQLSFMPPVRITAQSRIIIEFEYSERSYARTSMSAGIEAMTERGRFALQYIAETDLRNQNFQQALDASDKALLADVGDSLWKAVIPRIDTVPFNGDEVLYKQVDTLVSGTLYQGVYVYSTHPDSAKYRLGFSYLGPGKGNYVRVRSSANGKVYQWVAPVGGQASGEYEPVSRLVAPGKQQVTSLDAQYRVGRNLFLSTGLALSHSDINTFSSLDDDDDLGLAGQASLEYRRLLGPDSAWELRNGIAYQRIGADFRGFDRFREAEFERDWNLAGQAIPADEGEWSLWTSLRHGEELQGAYRYANLSRGDYGGQRHSWSLGGALGRDRVLIEGSYLSTTTSSVQSGFYRHNVMLSSRRGKWKLDMKNQLEDNRIREDDSLQAGSQSFTRTEIRLSREGEAGASSLAWILRDDLLPGDIDMKAYSRSQDIEFSTLARKSETGMIDISLAWRNIEYEDSGSGSSEAFLLARMRGDMKLASGAIRLGASYETSSGAELRKEYAYLRVADGQGVFAWTDYNNDSIKQLDEFEVAVFNDQANYLRVFIPTDDYVRVFRNALNADLTVRAPTSWRKEEGLRSFLSRLSLEAVARMNKRNSEDGGKQVYSPFTGPDPGDGVIGFNRQLRANLYFNRGNPRFSLSLGAKEQGQRNLLANGFESQSGSALEALSRFRIYSDLNAQLGAERRMRSSSSEFFGSRNFELSGWRLEPRLEYQPGRTYRITLYYRFSDYTNTSTEEYSAVRDLGVEARYSFPGKGMASARLSRNSVSYDGDPASPAGWEMLGSLLPGINYTWTTGVQRNIRENLQLNLMYEGRKLAGRSVIHTGSVQVRAYF